MSIGQLRERLRFEARSQVKDDYRNADGYGNTEGEWTCQFSAAARIRPTKGIGSETIIADRLAGTQPVIITIRSHLLARQVTPAWRAVDARKGTIYNLRSGANFDENNRFIDFLADSGVST